MNAEQHILESGGKRPQQNIINHAIVTKGGEYGHKNDELEIRGGGGAKFLIAPPN